MSQQTAPEARRTRSSAPPPSADPIYVPITPTGEGAIGTFLLDGSEVLDRFVPLFKSRKKITTSSPGQIVLGRLVDEEGRIVDEAIASPQAATETETGCEQIELSCHGGLGVSEAIADLLESAGIRKGLPWELEARGHRAAKLSLPAIEARIQLAAAVTAPQTEILLGYSEFQKFWERQGLEAALGTRKNEIMWREPLFNVAAKAVQETEIALRLLKTHRVVLAGPANAGKSTLVNCLLRAAESIVSDKPGTTRDRLERPAALSGLTLNLIDSAGIQDIDKAAKGGDGVDAEAQRRAFAAATAADLVLIVIDGSRRPTESDLDVATSLSRQPHVLVMNKSDLGFDAEAEGLPFSLGSEAVQVSSLSGDGIPELEALIASALLRGPMPTVGCGFTERHLNHLQALHEGLEQGQDGRALLSHIRALVGTRPNEAELALVLGFAALK